MSMNITFTNAAINRAKRQLEKNMQKFIKKCERFELEIAKLGMETAQGTYGYSVDLSLNKIPNGYEIIGNGKAICFLEFGAGTTTAESHPFKIKVPFEVKEGSYSKTHADQIAKYGGWYFGRRFYTKVEPRKGMLAAYMKIIMNVYDIATRIFK